MTEEAWQQGFAVGRSSALNQFIRDECDKQMTEKELMKLIIQLASLEKYVKEHAPMTYQAWKAQYES